MTTQNDLITTASNLTTAKKAVAAAASAAAAVAVAATEATSSQSTAVVARGTSPADVVAATIATTQSAQIGLTTQSTDGQTQAQTAAATSTGTAAPQATGATSAELLISTIHPCSTEKAAEAEVEMEMDVHNSIEASGKMAGVPDSLTKGFSIPTFLPPFPVFAAADLPAYRAAADAAAAAAAKLAAEAAKAAAEAAASSDAVTISPEEQRRRMYNEQHSYLAAHRDAADGTGPAVRRNLTMPVLNITAQMGNHAYMPCQVSRTLEKIKSGMPGMPHV